MGGTWLLVGSGPTARRGWAAARARYPESSVAAVNGAPDICGTPDLYLCVERDATRFYRGAVRACRIADTEAWISERVRSSPFLEDGWPEATLLDHTFGPEELKDLHRAAKRWTVKGGKRRFTSRRIDLTAGVYALWVLLETKRPERVVVVGFDGYAAPSKADVNERNGEAIGRLTEHYTAATVEWVGTPRNLNAGHPWRVMVSTIDEGAEVKPVGDYDEQIARRLIWPPGPTDQTGEDWVLLGPGPSCREGLRRVRERYPHALTFAVNAAYRLCPLPEAFAVWEIDALEGPVRNGKRDGRAGLRRPIDCMVDAGSTHVYTSERIRRRLRMPPRVHGIKPCWGPPELHDLHQRRDDPAWGPDGARLNCGLYALWVLFEVYRPRTVHVVGFDGYAPGDCYADDMTILDTEPREASLVARNRYMGEITARLTQHYGCGTPEGPRVLWWGVPRHLTDEAAVELVPLDGPLDGEVVSFADVAKARYEARAEAVREAVSAESTELVETEDVPASDPDPDPDQPAFDWRARQRRRRAHLEEATNEVIEASRGMATTIDDAAHDAPSIPPLDPFGET